MRRVFYGVLSTLSALVLAGSYYFSLHDASATAAVVSSERDASANSSSATRLSSGDSASPTPKQASETAPEATMKTATFLRDGSYTGTAVSTRYGAVQVAITVSDGRISDVQLPQYPQGGGREQRINAQAVPQLISETVQAQSAHIDMVSGATYTMNGYLDSLQSALDQARA